MLTTRIVDVFDRQGTHIAAYTVCLEDPACLDCEFEEVALAFVERSGRVSPRQLPTLIARCHSDNF